MNKDPNEPVSRLHTTVPLRRVLALFRPYRQLSCLIVLLALTGSMLSLATPLMLKTVIDTAIPSGSEALLWSLGAGVLAVSLLSGLLDVWQNHLEHKVGQSIMRDLRLRLYGNVLRQSISFFTRSRAGDILQRLTGDIQKIQSVVTRSVVTAITQSTVWIASIILLLVLDVKLALFALLLLPLHLYPARKTAKARKRLVKEAQRFKSDLSSHLAETTGISGALLTALYGGEAYQTAKFAKLNEIVMRLELRMNLMGRWITMFNGVLPSIGIIMVYMYGGFKVMEGSMTVGGIVAFAAYLSRLYGPTQQLLNLHSDVVSSLAVFENVFEYEDMQPEVKTAEYAPQLPAVTGHVRFRDVSFHYGPDKLTLCDISFEARPGEVVAIVGPSGAGKSTLLSMLARLHDPVSGTIEIDGRDIRGVSLDSLRKSIAFVTQQTHLFHASIRDNLLFACPGATDEELADACRKACILEYVQSLPEGFETIVGERGFRLSGGQQQRLSIARAILKKPRILVLDEATSHLDTQSEALVQAALEQLMKGNTTLVIAHRLSTIVNADRIIALENGRVAETGTHRELLGRNGLYAKLISSLDNRM